MNPINQFTGINEELNKMNKEVEGLNAKETFLVNKQIEQDLICSECNMYPKEFSSYCSVCFKSKMQSYE